MITEVLKYLGYGKKLKHTLELTKISMSVCLVYVFLQSIYVFS